MKINNKELTEYTDEELMVFMVKATDQASLRSLYTVVVERNYQPLVSYVNKLIRDNSFETHDIVHNTFIKALENYKSFNNDASVRTWLCAIARNDFINESRAIKRKPPNQDVPVEEVLQDENYEINDPDYSDVREEVVNSFTEYETPEFIYEGLETLEAVEDMVEELPEHLQDLFIARYIDQLDYQEISARFERPIGTIKNRLYELNQLIQETINDRK